MKEYMEQKVDRLKESSDLMMRRRHLGRSQKAKVELQRHCTDLARKSRKRTLVPITSLRQMEPQSNEAAQEASVVLARSTKLEDGDWQKSTEEGTSAIPEGGTKVYESSQEPERMLTVTVPSHDPLLGSVGESFEDVFSIDIDFDLEQDLYGF